MHKTARPILLRAARRPDSILCRTTCQLHPYLSSYPQVAPRRRCLSTSPRRIIQFNPFVDLEQGGDISSLHVQIHDYDATDPPAAWIRTLEHFLPADLRGSKNAELGEQSSQHVVRLRRDVSHVLIEAQNHDGFDILTHLGLEKGRWDVVAWVVKEVAEGHRSFNTLIRDIQATGIQWPEHESLDELTEMPSLEPSFLPPPHSSILMRTTQFGADPRVWNKRLHRGAIGQIWRTLGSLILKASTETAEQSRTIMSHVLSIIATLHHSDIVPEAVYQHNSELDPSVLQMPPILHMLSSRMMTALSEAAWNAHQTSPPIKRVKFLSNQLPGTRYNSQIEELRPEVWLELVLWSCLHGPWVMDGAAVLEMMQGHSGSSTWSLVCWTHALAMADLDPRASTSFAWTDFMDVLEGAGPQVRRHPDGRSMIERTISSESVAAYVNALANMIYTGVGDRGVLAGTVISHLKRLKSLLDEQKLGLGYATWDAVVQRVVESGGVVIERDPSLMLDVLSLVQPYGAEWETRNAPIPDGYPYFFDASASALGLFHRVIQAHVNLASVEGALASLRTLQEFTDRNQRRSIEQFFQQLKDKRPKNPIPAGQGGNFAAGFFSVDYPSFSPQIPADVLSNLLDLFTEAGMSTHATQLLQSDDPSGPFIPESFYLEPALAPALVRFATASNNKPMLQRVINLQSHLSKSGRAAIPEPVLTALLASQIARRRWESVHNVLTTALEEDKNQWHPSLACSLAAELLRMEKSPEYAGAEGFTKAMTVFKSLLRMSYGLPTPYVSLRAGHPKDTSASKMLHSVLGVLSSVTPEWAHFCDTLSFGSARNRSNALAIGTRDFDTILQGVVDGHGVHIGRRLVEQWCIDVEELGRVGGWAGGRMPGGVRKLSKMRILQNPGERYFDDKWRVHVDIPGSPDRPMLFQGRIKPTFGTLRIILRRVLEEEMKGEGIDKDMLDWIVRMLNSLGYFGEEASREIQRVREGVVWKRNKA